MTRRRLAQVWRHIPFTLTVVSVMLVVGVATGSLWNALEGRPLFADVAYGLPSFQDGLWWTPVTGAFFAIAPWQYVPVALGFLVLAGLTELAMGTRRAAIAVVVTQLAGVLGAAALLAVLTATLDWAWAEKTAAVIDVGFSAGAMGGLAAATAAFRAPWRGRVRFALVMYAVLAFLYIGVLWDLEHLIAVAVGLPLGPYLMGRRPRLGVPSLSRREWRLTAAVTFGLSAVIRLLLWFVPGEGPLGAVTGDSTVTSMLLGAGISAALAFGLWRGRKLAWLLGLVVSVLSLLGLLLVGLYVAAAVPESEVTAIPIPELVVDVALWAAQFGVLVFGSHAFQVSRRARGAAASRNSSAEQEARARALLARHGGSSLAWMTTWPGNRWHVGTDDAGEDRGFAAYQVHRGMAIGLCDPVGPDVAARGAVLEGLLEEQGALGRTVCLFSVTQEVADWGLARGWQAVVVADEALIDLPSLEFKGKSWQDVRTALNRAGRDGITARIGPLAEMPRGLVSQVRSISEQWVGDKGLPEMGFTLGGVDEALDPEVTCVLAVDADGTVLGVTSWLPVYGPDGAIEGRTLDVIRRLPDGFKSTAEFLIASACLHFKEAGCQYVSLSGAPLAQHGDPESAQPLDRLLGWLGETMEPLYGFRSLEAFKAKFAPRHRPLYLVFADESQLPRIGLAMTKAYLPDASMAQLAAAGLSTARAESP